MTCFPLVRGENMQVFKHLHSRIPGFFQGSMKFTATPLRQGASKRSHFERHSGLFLNAEVVENTRKDRRKRVEVNLSPITNLLQGALNFRDTFIFLTSAHFNPGLLKGFSFLNIGARRGATSILGRHVIYINN